MQKGGNEQKSVKINRTTAFGKARAPLTTPAAPAYDAAAGEKALAQVRPLLMELEAEEIESPHFDLELAAMAALRVARLVREPSLLERFRAMPETEFDRETLDRLEPFAWAAWHAHRAHQVLALSASAATVPVALAEAATELERRMQRCVEYRRDGKLSAVTVSLPDPALQSVPQRAVAPFPVAVVASRSPFPQADIQACFGLFWLAILRREGGAHAKGGRG